jgi:hypothetical protein
MVIPAETRTTAIVGGTPQVVCDPRCALTHQKQMHRAVSLARVRSAAHASCPSSDSCAETADAQGDSVDVAFGPWSVAIDRIKIFPVE